MTASLTTDRRLERIAGLLAKAENTDNQAERDIFLAKAQELGTLYSIDLAKARMLTDSKVRTKPEQRTITLGTRGTRGLNTYVSLISGIARANDVKINIAHNSTYVIAFGFKEDIDMVQALFVSLLTQMVVASEEFKAAGEWKQDTRYTKVRTANPEYSPGSYWNGDKYYYDWERRPISWLTARLDFQEGFASRIGDRLFTAKREAEQAQVAADVAVVAAEDIAVGVTGTELVLASKREEIDDFYKKTSTARGSYRGGRDTISGTSSRAGRSAADRASLGGRSSLPGSRAALS